MSSATVLNPIPSLRLPRRAWCRSLLIAALLPMTTLGQEWPKATPEGKQALDGLIRDGEKAGGLRVKRDEKNRVVELSATDAGKLQGLVDRDSVRKDLRLRDAIIAEASVYDVRRAGAWCTVLQLLADSSHDDLTRGFHEYFDAVRIAIEHKDYPAAIKKLVSAAERFEKLKTPAYQARCLHTCGVIHSMRREYDKALELHLKSAELFCTAYGENDSRFAQALKEVGLSHKNKGDSVSALDYFQRSLRAYQGAREESEISAVLLEIGLIRAARKEHEKAAESFGQSLSLKRKVRGAAHIETARMAKQIAKAWFDIGESNRALDLYQQALVVFRSAAGAGPTDVADVLDSIGLCHRRLTQNDRALAAFEESLALKRKALGEQHRDVAWTLGSLAETQRDLGLYDDALANSQQVLAIRRKVLGERDPAVDSTLEVIAHLHFLGRDYQKALDVYQQALEIRRASRPERPLDVAWTLNNLGSVYQNMGRFDEAREHYQQALDIRRKALGEQRSEVAQMLDMLGGLASSRGDDADALKHYEQAMEIRRKTSGEQHPDMANSLVNIGFIARKQRQYARALELIQKALEIRKKAFGDAAPIIADTLNEIGHVYNFQSDYIHARPYYEQALSIRRKALGDRHQDVAIDLINIGDSWRYQGRPELALEAYQQALTIRRERLGEHHPDVAYVLDEIGHAYAKREDYRHAAEFYERALAIRRKAFGDVHLDVAYDLVNVGDAWKNLNRHEEALDAYRQALAIRRKLLGPKHEDVARALIAIGNVYERQIRFTEAIDQYQQALQVARALREGPSPLLADALRNLGRAYRARQEFTRSQEYYEKALAAYRETKGEKNDDVADVLDELGWNYSNRGLYDKAIGVHQKALEIHRALHGEHSPAAAYILHHLGYDCQSQGDFDKALDYIKQALTLRRRTFGRGHGALADSLADIGSLYAMQGEFEQALTYFRRAQEIRRIAFGPDSEEAAQSLENLGDLALRQGEYEKSLGHLQQALAIRLRRSGRMNGRVANIFYSMGYNHYALGEQVKAEDYLSQAIEIYQKIYGKDHPRIAFCHHALGLLFADRGEYSRAWNSFFECRRIMRAPENARNPSYSPLRASVGTLYTKLGLHFIARQEYIDTLKEEETLQGANTLNIGLILDQLGNSQRELGELREAIASLERAASIYRKYLGDHSPMVARMLRDMAETYGDDGKFDQAIAKLDEALKVLLVRPADRVPPLTDLSPGDLKPLPQTVTVLRNRGYWLFRKTRDHATLEQLREAERCYALGEAVHERVRRDLLQTEESKLNAGSNQFGMYPSHIAILGQLFEREPSRDRLEAIFLAAERGTARVLVEQIGQSRSRVLGQVKGDYLREEETIQKAMRELDARIAHEESKSVGQYDPREAGRLNEQRERVEEQRKALIGRIERESPRYAALNYPKPCSLEEARACLGPNEVALLFAVGWDNEPSTVILIEPQAAPSDASGGVTIAGLAASRQEIRELVEVLTDPQTLKLPDRTRALGAEAFAMLLGPLRDRIRGKDLVIVPTDVLSLLPFELLVERDPGGAEPAERFLLENHRIRYAPSMTVLHLTRQWIKSRPQPDITFWGMGDPIYDPNDERMIGRSTTKIASAVAEPSPLREIQLREGNASARDPFPRLTYSGEEVRRIGRLLGATEENLLLDLSASEAKVREASASNTLSRARYVHFATHGVLGLDRGQLPALVLSQVGNSQRRDELGTDDGLLQLDEITRLKLNADLVVLSACRSGRGRMRSGEGVSSLARAFLIVGCRGVVCSLWAVADRETADLFTAVYGGLKDGRTSAEALRAAKLAHLRSGKAPFFWAPFVLVGGEPGVSAGANPPLTAEVAGPGSKP